MEPADAQAMLHLTVKLMYLIPKKTDLTDDWGRKVCLPDRTRAIQAGHTFCRLTEKLVDIETEEDFQQLIGSWQSAWLFERLMAENILETTFRIAELLFWGLKGVLAPEDIEDAFPLIRRIGLWAT